MAYGTEAGLQAYAVERGITLTGSEEQRDGARQRASDWIDAQYGPLFPGSPNTGLGGPQWPRDGASDCYGNVIAPDAVPVQVERAVYAAAIYDVANSGALTETVFRRSDGGKVLTKLDVMGWTLPEGARAESLADVRPILSTVEDHLSTLLCGNGLDARNTGWYGFVV